MTIRTSLDDNWDVIEACVTRPLVEFCILIRSGSRSNYAVAKQSKQKVLDQMQKAGINQDFNQARRQEFPEGRSSTRVALTAGGLGAVQGPQKLWGIWKKILKSSNFQALHSNFRKVLFFKTDYMIFTEFYTNLGINFEKKNVDFNSAYLFSRGGGVVRTPRNPPGYGCVNSCIKHICLFQSSRMV